MQYAPTIPRKTMVIRRTQSDSRPAALITGGAKGMGAAFARALAEDGYNIGIVTRRSERAAQRVVRDCEKHGVTARYWLADLTDIADTERVAKEFQRTFKRWDVLINNVGDYWWGPILRMKTETLKAMFQSNFSSATRLSLLAVKAMRKRGTGRIINIGWVFADRLQAIPHAAAYQAAKTALLSFSSALAKEAIRDGITINMVSPGIHYTTVNPPKDPARIIPAGRMGNDRDMIGAIRYFLSPEASYVTGSHLKVSGGYGV
jgi:NAD(P)-dependent dehydrogenase (short-subunit alcohol dehydrogenase family)